LQYQTLDTLATPHQYLKSGYSSNIIMADIKCEICGALNRPLSSFIYYTEYSYDDYYKTDSRYVLIPQSLSVLIVTRCSIRTMEINQIRQNIPEYNVTSLPGNLLPLLEILYISLNTVTLSRAKLIVQLLMITSVGCFSYLNFEIKVISLDHLVSE
jgi:hypothetical protein